MAVMVNILDMARPWPDSLELKSLDAKPESEDNTLMAQTALFHVSHPEVVRGCQIRAARALLDWSIPVAADRCQVGVNTISRFEKGHRSPQPGILLEIVRVFQEHGVVFIDTDAGRGVLLIDESGGPAV